MLWLGRGLQLGKRQQLGTRGKERDAGGGSTGQCQGRGWGRRVTRRRSPTIPTAMPNRPHHSEAAASAWRHPCRQALPHGAAPGHTWLQPGTGHRLPAPQDFAETPQPSLPSPHQHRVEPPSTSPTSRQRLAKGGGHGGSPVLGSARAPRCDAGTAPRTHEDGGGHGVVATPPARRGSEMGRRASAVGWVTRRDRERRGASAAPASAGKTCPPSHGTRALGQPSHGCLCPGERGSLRDHLGGLQRGHPDPAKGRGPRTAGLREPRRSAHTSRLCQDNRQPRQHVG